jgi:hypothetical protein
VLYFPNHLGDVLGPGGAPSGTRYYSWKDGFISVKGRETREKLTTVVAEASRGDKLLKVASTAEIKPGQMVRLSQSDSDDRSLLRHLHADELPGGIYSELRMGFVSRVAGVEGNTIILERPLRADVRLPWEPEIHAYVPSVQEVGIENLTLEFPQIKYGGHLNELGYNGIQVRNAANCWIRNLKFRNADNGIFLDLTKFCTVQGVYLGAYDGGLADAGRYGIASGHHALLVRGADDNLFTDFEIDTVFVHDITVDSGSSGNVFSQGKAIDLTLDHHKRAPFENLFTDIDVGEGTRLWTSGGSSRIGSPHSGARETFWNIRGKNSLGWPSHQSYDDQPWGPKQLNVVGITTNNPSIETPDGKWFEAIDPAKLVPQNLHLAQLANRLK